MKFDPEKIKKDAKENFDHAWNEGKKMVKMPTLNERYPRTTLRYGKAHPVYDTIQKLREAYMRMGFEEMMNPLIVHEKEVHKQFGSEDSQHLTSVLSCRSARPHCGDFGTYASNKHRSGYLT